MVMSLSASLWDPQASNGAAKVAAWPALVAEELQPQLLPPQFTLATFSRLGGRMVEWSQEAQPIALGYCLPAQAEDGTSYRLISYLPVARHALPHVDIKTLKSALGWLGPQGKVRLFDIVSSAHWADPPIWETIADIAYGPPRTQDAQALRQLQAQVWQAQPENLYPTFIHHPDCQMTWSLVARAKDQVVGFLLGFRHGREIPALPPGWPSPKAAGEVFESQALGVHPDFRQRHIAFHLKRIQAQELQKQGVTHIQWTADPLQYRNARLNCDRLGAVGTQLLPDYLPFRNQLNQLPASRLQVIWSLPTSPAQRTLMQGKAFAPLDLDVQADCLQVHDNLQQVRLNLDAPCLAIEIPTDWTRMQRTDLPLAQAWRDTTDAILKRYLGPMPGQYLITRTSRQGDNRYLLARRVGSVLHSMYRP